MTKENACGTEPWAFFNGYILIYKNTIVNAVAPGFSETEMGFDSITEAEKEKLLAETPLKRLARPEEGGNGILDMNGASYLRS